MHNSKSSNGCEPEIMRGEKGRSERERETRTNTRVDNFIKIKRIKRKPNHDRIGSDRIGSAQIQKE